jgi:hypothetical protein
LLTAAKLILEQKDRFHNGTVILVVDRTELEGQLYATDLGQKSSFISDGQKVAAIPCDLYAGFATGKEKIKI